jgi:hypothetical protein
VVDNILPNWGDEAYAAFPAAKALLTGKPVGKAFDEGQAQFRKNQKQYDEEHPNLAWGSTIGGIGASLLLPGGAAVRGASLASKGLQAAKIAALYGAVTGAGKGDDLEERLSNSLATAGVTGVMGGLSPLAVRGAGALAQQARLRVPGVDAAARVAGDSLQRVANVGRKAIGRTPSRIAPPSTRARPQANRMLAEAIGNGPIRQGQQTIAATPAVVADEVERRAAMNVPAMVGDVTTPLTHATGWASRGNGPGQQMVRSAIAERKANEALRLRQHVTETLGPVVDPIAQMETHMATAKAAAAPGYRAAYAEPMVVTPEIEAIMSTPAFREAVPHAVRNIQNAKGSPTGMGFRMDAQGNIEGVDTLSTEGFDQVIRAMRDSGRAAADVNPITGKVINNTNSVHINARAGELRDHLSAQNPAYADVTGRYADDMAVRDAFTQGQEGASLTGHEVNAQARAMPVSAHDAWSIGARSALADDVSSHATAHPSADSAGRLKTLLGDDTKQDALGQMTGNTGAVRGLQNRLDAEQQAHGVWQEVQRNAGATRRATTDGLDAQMGGNGPGALTWRGKAMETIGNVLDKAEPQYRKDVRDHVSSVLTEQDPATVRGRMADVTAQTERDADLAQMIQNIQTSGLKGLYSVTDPYGRNDSD